MSYHTLPHGPLLVVNIRRDTGEVMQHLVSYVVTVKAPPGRMDIAKATALGVPKDFTLARLKVCRTYGMDLFPVCEHGANNHVWCSSWEPCPLMLYLRPE